MRKKKRAGELAFFTNFHRESVSLAIKPKEICIQQINFIEKEDSTPMLNGNADYEKHEENLLQRRRTLERRDTIMKKSRKQKADFLNA